jgi:malonyl-CoA O-methyltransferase
MDHLNYKLVVAKNFSRRAKDYDQSAALQQAVGLSLIERLKLISINPQTILDLGSGTNYLSKILKPHYPTAKIINLDIAESMLSFSQKENIFPQDFFVCTDAEKMPFQTNSFDLIISNFVFHWFLEPQNVLEQINRVLKPGGLLLFSTVGPDTLKELKTAFSTIDNAPHVNHFLDMHDIGDLLIATNFQNPVMDMEILTLTYSSLANLHRDLKLTGSHTVLSEMIKGLSPKNFREKLSLAYEVYRDDEKRLPASFEIIYGHAFGSPQKRLHRADKSGVIRIPVEDLMGSL